MDVRPPARHGSKRARDGARRALRYSPGRNARYPLGFERHCRADLARRSQQRLLPRPLYTAVPSRVFRSRIGNWVLRRRLHGGLHAELPELVAVRPQQVVRISPQPMLWVARASRLTNVVPTSLASPATISTMQPSNTYLTIFGYISPGDPIDGVPPLENELQETGRLLLLTGKPRPDSRPS